MKTLNFKITYLLAVIVLSFLSVSTMRAQGAFAPYQVNNNLPCDIIIDWEVRKLGTCSTICDSGSGITVNGGGGSFTIPAFGSSGSCSSNNDEGCVLYITVTQIGGTSTNFLGTSNATPSPTSIANAVAGCTSANSIYVCDTGNFNIAY